MKFEEPKVEVVEIDPSETVVASGDVGGGQRCIGSQPEAQSCADWDTSIPYNS